MTNKELQYKVWNQVRNQLFDQVFNQVRSQIIQAALHKNNI